MKNKGKFAGLSYGMDFVFLKIISLPETRNLYKRKQL